MNIYNLLKKLGFALNCAALTLIASAAMAADIRANAGTTFTLFPSIEPGLLNHTVDGIVQVTFGGSPGVDGTYIFHADVTARVPDTADQPLALAGNFKFTSADGASTLTAVVTGAVSTDLVNPALANFQYQATITGGSGALASTRGQARIEGAAMFTSASTGTATWTMKGQVIGPTHDK